MEKPTIEQVAWVFQKLVQHLDEGGSYRYLCYERLGFDESSYVPLYRAGGMALSNLMHDHNDLLEQLEKIQGELVDCWNSKEEQK